MCDKKRPIEIARFSEMVEALGEAGLSAKHAFTDSSAELEKAVASHNTDIVFCSHFRSTEGEYLRELLIKNGVAWIGSSTETMELALSKPRMKLRWRASGIPTPDWIVARKNADGAIEGIEMLENLRDFPYIVKPASEGNSRGIDAGSVVRSPLELFARTTAVTEEFGESLVERFVSGAADSREFTAAMIGSGPRAIVAAVEIRKPSPDGLLISEQDKESQSTVLATIEDAKLMRKVEQLARRVFVSANARDYARCDILMHEGKLYAIEMNGQPMVPDRWFEACAREAGLGSRQYLAAVALAGIVSNAETGHAFIPIPREMSKVLSADAYKRLVGR